MKKKTLAGILGAAMTMAVAMPTYAGQWLSDANGWWWQNDNGSYPTNTWQWIDGNKDGVAESYYFNEQGYCLLNTTTPDGYMVNENGAWTVNGEVQAIVNVEQEDSYFEEDGFEQKKMTSEEILDTIQDDIEEKFGKEFMPFHYTKKGLIEDINLDIGGAGFLDCRDKDDTNIFMAFSSRNDDLKNELEKYKERLASDGIIYEKSNYMFYIDLKDANTDDVIMIINNIIK